MVAGASHFLLLGRLFFARRCCWVFGDRPGLPDSVGVASQDGAAFDLASIAFIPSSSAAATSFCLASVTVVGEWLKLQRAEHAPSKW